MREHFIAKAKCHAPYETNFNLHFTTGSGILYLLFDIYPTV